MGFTNSSEFPHISILANIVKQKHKALVILNKYSVRLLEIVFIYLLVISETYHSSKFGFLIINLTFLFLLTIVFLVAALVSLHSVSFPGIYFKVTFCLEQFSLSILYITL